MRSRAARLVARFSDRARREHPFHLTGQVVMRDSIRIEPGDAYVLEKAPGPGAPRQARSAAVPSLAPTSG